MWPTAASQFPQQFPSYSNRKCKKIAVFTYRSPHFVSPGDAPAIITKRYGNIPTGTLLTGVSNAGGVGKKFSANIWLHCVL